MRNTSKTRKRKMYTFNRFCGKETYILPMFSSFAKDIFTKKEQGENDDKLKWTGFVALVDIF